ncbi:hypothetical protein NDU88_009819 [Pleurodeles waltl]|uniref:Uncharacterized protein n=1 Tax=Pleurodeles waltl TaxID=8319 RepID=A0AAV7QSN0_PLEWA|nr:hypothetical protein NDU88_009819 [Pleurodeles waltl]
MTVDTRSTCDPYLSSVRYFTDAFISQPSLLRFVRLSEADFKKDVLAVSGSSLLLTAVHQRCDNCGD